MNIKSIKMCNCISCLSTCNELRTIQVCACVCVNCRQKDVLVQVDTGLWRRHWRCWDSFSTCYAALLPPPSHAVVLTNSVLATNVTMTSLPVPAQQRLAAKVVVFVKIAVCCSKHSAWRALALKLWRHRRRGVTTRPRAPIWCHRHRRMTSHAPAPMWWMTSAWRSSAVTWTWRHTAFCLPVTSANYYRPIRAASTRRKRMRPINADWAWKCAKSGEIWPTSGHARGWSVRVAMTTDGVVATRWRWGWSKRWAHEHWPHCIGSPTAPGPASPPLPTGELTIWIRRHHRTTTTTNRSSTTTNHVTTGNCRWHAPSPPRWRSNQGATTASHVTGGCRRWHAQSRL